jgi:hypothetical protein
MAVHCEGKYSIKITIPETLEILQARLVAAYKAPVERIECIYYEEDFESPFLIFD